MAKYVVDLRVDKPRGLTSEHAATFQDKSVVDSYKFRNPYPAEIFSILKSLAPPTPQALDIGCGTGDIALALSRFCRSVDAVDFSENMISEARARDKEGAVNWFAETVESLSTSKRYDLITSGDSLHWMDWKVVFPKMKVLLNEGCFLAIINRGYANKDWWTDDLTKVINKYSTNKEYVPYNVVEEVVQRGYFDPKGRTVTKNVEFSQTVSELISAFQSRNGLSEDAMGKAESDSFRREMRELLAPFSVKDRIDLGSSSSVTWGIVL